VAQAASPMEIFKLLDKSNCRECGEPTCLAFAAAVFRGQRRLGDCPHLESEVIERFGGEPEGRASTEEGLETAVEQLRVQIAAVDLDAAAPRVGASFSHGKLTLKILGKDFTVDSQGGLASDIHIHPWVTIPILSYIIRSKGTPVAGEWVPFRELKNGKTWYRLFEQRCEKPLKRVADTHTDLFENMIRIFNAKQVENHYEADISLVLKPLPKVPILICYWKPEEDLESSLNLFFDSTAEDHLNIESIFSLGTGLVRMFEKIASWHSFQ
jgi:hypothetical protein